MKKEEARILDLVHIVEGTLETSELFNFLRGKNNQIRGYQLHWIEDSPESVNQYYATKKFSHGVRRVLLTFYPAGNFTVASSTKRLVKAFYDQFMIDFGDYLREKGLS